LRAAMFLSSKRLIFGVRVARFVQTSRQYTSSVVISQIVCYKDKQFACSRYRLINSVKPVFQNSDRSASSLSKMSSTDNSDRLVWIDCEVYNTSYQLVSLEILINYIYSKVCRIWGSLKILKIIKYVHTTRRF